MNALDRVFLAGETRESMMHVGALIPFSPPTEGARDHLLRSLIEELKQTPKVYAPWNLKLRFPEMLKNPLQAWVEDTEFDVDYHVRRSALPSPGDERELGILVSRLHSHQIDFHRPPWEVHFIEGLEGGRFAIYFKVHHSLVDGYTGMKLMMRSLSHTADEHDTPMFFSLPPQSSETRQPRDARDEDAPARPDDGEDSATTFESLLSSTNAQLGATRDAVRALMNVLRRSRTNDSALVSPLQAPKSVINRKISRNRRFATQQFQQADLRKIAKSTGGTLNDVVLALCSAALRRLLREQDALPEETLTAMIPVNVRPKDDPGGGNAVGAILASLATDIEDPRARLRAIIASTRRAKEQLQGLSKSAIMQYSSMLLSPMMLSQIPSVVGRVRPAFNVVVSNVPGAEEPLYFRGWRAEALYPVSIPFHGYGLNITVNSYAGTLNFGFTGCRDTLPHMQRLAVYSGEALAELEGA